MTVSSPIRTLPYDRKLLGMYLLAVGIHGPLNLVITGIAWEFESNPVVLSFGLERWLILKVILLVAAAVVIVDSRQKNPEEYPAFAGAWLGALIGFGLALIFPNIAILAGVIS